MKPRSRAAWRKLSPGYRRRLERKGIGEAEYVAGASLSVARGHAATPEHPGRKLPYIRRAIAHGIISDTYIPPEWWAGMSAAEQYKAAHDFELAYFTKGQGARLTKEERGKRGLHPNDRRIYRHRSHEQELADVEFQQLMVEIHGHTWGREEWAEFRSHYYGTFNAAA